MWAPVERRALAYDAMARGGLREGKLSGARASKELAEVNPVIRESRLFAERGDVP